MIAELCDGQIEDRKILTQMLDGYLRELACYRERAVGVTDSGGYPYLDAYFAEPGRYPFIIRREGSVVGFAFVRGPESTGRGWELAEFYIVPGSRRSGIGSEALASIWHRFPGDWELQVYLRNTDAVRFWMSCLDKWATRAPEVEEVDAPDGRRLQFRFAVEHLG